MRVFQFAIIASVFASVACTRYEAQEYSRRTPLPKPGDNKPVPQNCPAIDGTWIYKKPLETGDTKDVAVTFARNDKNELQLLTEDQQDLVWPINGQIFVDKNGMEYKGTCDKQDVIIGVKPKGAKQAGILRFHMEADGKTGSLTMINEGKKQVMPMAREVGPGVTEPGTDAPAADVQVPLPEQPSEPVFPPDLTPQ